MDFLVTWNCKHIAGAMVRRVVEQVNVERGIRTPSEKGSELFSGEKRSGGGKG